MTQLLDCTLRDGGYYNQWDFSPDLVAEYLQAMETVGVDWIEIGFRFTPKNGFIGPYGYTTDAWLKTLQHPKGPRLGVMCNAKDLIEGQPSTEETIQQLFGPADHSPVDLVRLAAHFREAGQCAEAIRLLKGLGYRVGVNLMQAGGRTPQELQDHAGMLAETAPDVLYLADSMGSMTPDETERAIEAVRSVWDGSIGFHAHDNMGLALSNAEAAQRAGASWIDATVLGMGRGAGNLRLEYWLLEKTRHGGSVSGLETLLALVTTRFSELQKQFGWGPSLFYHLSALYNVHPTYVQEMLADERYSQNAVVTALQRLGAQDASGYDESRLRKVMDDPETAHSPGESDVSGVLHDQDVILIGPGEQGQHHRDGLLQLLERQTGYVLCLNSNAWLPAECVDAWVACNPERLTLDRPYYEQHRGRLIAPGPLARERLGADALARYEHVGYGMTVTTGGVQIGKREANLPAPLGALYAFAFAAAAGARRILLVGFDGYEIGDPRHAEMEDAIRAYEQAEGAIPLVALTPTTLNVTQRSVYEPSP